MYARAVDDAALRLRELRHDEWDDFGVAALALSLAVVAAEFRPQFALPLFLGGLAVLALGVRALWRRWDLVDRLAGERDTYVISEVMDYASRETTMERRHSFAALIRGRLRQPGVEFEASVAAAREELEALATELEDAELALDPDRADTTCWTKRGLCSTTGFYRPARSSASATRRRSWSARLGSFMPICSSSATAKRALGR